MCPEVNGTRVVRGCAWEEMGDGEEEGVRDRCRISVNSTHTVTDCVCVGDDCNAANDKKLSALIGVVFSLIVIRIFQ